MGWNDENGMKYFHKYGRVFKLLFPTYVWSIRTNEPNIYLTFDDGPVPKATEFVLDELAKFNAKATFFCVGENIVKHPEIYKRIIAEGHTVANHTYNHLNARRVRHNAYLENVMESDKLMRGDFKSQKYFRPPYARLQWWQINKIKKWGYKIIMWDVLTGDFDKLLDKEKALKKSIKATKKGSIVLFHDNVKHFENMSFLLPKYLKHFSEEGFKFKSL